MKHEKRTRWLAQQRQVDQFTQWAVDGDRLRRVAAKFADAVGELITRKATQNVITNGGMQAVIQGFVVD